MCGRCTDGPEAHRTQPLALHYSSFGAGCMISSITASWRVTSLWPLSQVLTNKCLPDSASTECGLVVDRLELNWHCDVAGHRHEIFCSCSACKYIVLLAPIATPVLVYDVQCLSVVASDGPACQCICLVSAGLKTNLRRLLS